MDESGGDESVPNILDVAGVEPEINGIQPIMSKRNENVENSVVGWHIPNCSIS